MSTSAELLSRLPVAQKISLAFVRLFERLLFKRPIDELTKIMGGHIFFVTLAAAARLDLFSLLKEKGPLSTEEIARLLDIEIQPARILLLGCTSLGLIYRKAGRYRLGRIARRLLVKDEPKNLLPIIDWQYFINYRAMYAFPEALKTNKNVGLDVFQGNEPTLYQRLVHVPDLEGVFQRAMEAISVQANHLLADYLDLSGTGLLVDVGGGNGTNIIRLAKRYPNLRAVVFDAPSVCQIAERNIAEAGLSNRLSAHSGDCFRDPFPDGCDAILFCHFFTIWSPERNRELLRKAYEALRPGGAVIVFNMMQDNDCSGPLTAAMGSPYFLTLATGEGMLYTWSEYESWMRDVGFSTVVQRKLVRHHGIIIGIR